MTSVTVNDNAANTDALIVNGTNGNNTITTAFAGGANRVWVNNQAVVNFSDFNQLTLNGKFGNDTFNVSPAGMTFVGANPTINVNGAVGTTNTLTVNDAAGLAVGYNPTGPGAGNVTVAGAAAVNMTHMAGVSVDGAGGKEALTVTTPLVAGIAGNTVVFTPGATANSGSIALRENGGAPPSAGAALVPLTYANFNIASTLTFASAGGRTDDLTINAVGVGDTFAVTGSSGAVVLTSDTGAFLALSSLLTPGASLLTLNAAGANTTFNVAGPLPYTDLFLDGGDGSDPAVVNLSGASGAVTVNYANESVTGYGGTVNLIGIATANLDASGQAVTVADATADTDLAVTPTGAAAATLQANGVCPSST